MLTKTVDHDRKRVMQLKMCPFEDNEGINDLFESFDFNNVPVFHRKK